MHLIEHFPGLNTNMNKLIMVTYNCTGLYKDRAEFIQNFRNKSDVDVVFLQETWLQETQFKHVKGICVEEDII